MVLKGERVAPRVISGCLSECVYFCVRSAEGAFPLLATLAVLTRCCHLVSSKTGIFSALMRTCALGRLPVHNEVGHNGQTRIRELLYSSYIVF